MSSCNIDHSIEDVVKKLESQKNFLPNDLFEQTSQALKQSLNQTTLNELFHILKKYDLATIEEQQARNQKLEELLIKL